MEITRIIVVLGLMLAGGAGIAQTVIHDDARWYDGAGATPLVLYTRDRVTAYKVFGGFALPRHFSLEATYFDPRRFALSTPPVPNDTLVARLRARGFDISLPSRLPREWRANPRIGAGLQDLFARNWALRGEWERYRISEAGRGRGNFDAWIVDLVYKIGGTPASRSNSAPGAVSP